MNYPNFPPRKDLEGVLAVTFEQCWKRERPSDSNDPGHYYTIRLNNAHFLHILEHCIHDMRLRDQLFLQIGYKVLQDGMHQVLDLIVEEKIPIVVRRRVQTLAGKTFWHYDIARQDYRAKPEEEALPKIPLDDPK
jgi:hypothetical protein